ncbi:hypothetical protein [Arthrobacter zhaoguopingii]|uniref:hypothetical protein n=1 Tax=Arthrobacter zhaoguopingii TaxID=2681491 RepID=UPI00135CA966|nr:hypothetical protein [Arthrobacter zhaoguopingii]
MDTPDPVPAARDPAGKDGFAPTAVGMQEAIASCDISTARSAEHYSFLAFSLMSSPNTRSVNIKVVA